MLLTAISTLSYGYVMYFLSLWSVQRETTVHILLRVLLLVTGELNVFYHNSFTI